ncbi:carbohydrate-binding module family 18 protein [Cercospora zeae-maydis SCOH1-5]|uniref:Carbohydrate-binding module family 18 protein n=1 Tax=Cercospora zeae-maydis SCOH1-5 TaxID=717836 RepID=A0A6A6FMH8_9PEZI|nr:carbohydrate-binding module family 18 protein [Cercospora zeae-maydis SCOH1-5]
MKALRGLLLGATVVQANIIFPFAQPTCDSSGRNFTGCLRGQICLPNNTCIPASLSTRADAPPREDGRCGKDFDEATCDAGGNYGGCCSSQGYCGKTSAHCLLKNGCQNGCESPTASAAPQPTDHEPILGKPSEPPTTDGTCGADNGGSICGNWEYGSCCSMMGFCGNTSAHCGEGCQSGPCDQAPVSAAPGPVPAPPHPNPGAFKIVGDSGAPAMHAALMPNGKVMFLDKVENYTKLNLSDGRFAYSAEYDPATNEVVPLGYKTNAFCAGGGFLANGTLLSIGGNGNLSWLDPEVEDGWKGLRYLTRSSSDDTFDGEDWIEPGNRLDTARWYPTVQTMPDGMIFVASGSLNGLDPAKNENNNPTYEILDKNGVTNGESISLELLVKAQPYYMYPFIHLLPDGNLFIFTSKSSEVFGVGDGRTIKPLPDLPGDYRTYPNTGGSVLLPLSSANDWNADVVICGGGAYQDITSPTDASCGRIAPLNENADWEMDSMPKGRGMVEGTLLPDGTVLWLNGANKGAQGFGLAEDPTLGALIYDPAAKLGERWSTGAKSEIPRLYHSVALLLLDGTVMIAGSNPVDMPVLEASEETPFPTEFRVEIYTPPYLSGDNAKKRPQNVVLESKELKADGMAFEVLFDAPGGANEVKIVLYHGGFVTHSLHMGHRMLYLDTEGFEAGKMEQKVDATMPPNSNIAPPGPYVVYVVVDGVPAIGQFVMVE